MKVALIYPGKKADEKQLPLGLGYLASFILRENNDNEVTVLDTAVATPRETKVFFGKDCDIFGITVTSRAYREAVELSRNLKRIHADVPIVFGGPHISLVMDQILQEPSIDIAVYGEGELTFSELIKSLRRNEKKLNIRDLGRINGLIYRDNSRVVKTPPRDLIQDLDTLPFPAFDLFPMTRYPGKYPMITSRGCPFLCVFCASSQIWGRKWRARSPENIIAEVQYLVTNFRSRPIDFHDDGFNMNLKRVNAICDLLLKENIKIAWGVRGFRADIINANIAQKMRRAGCTHVAIGIESANNDMLNRMGKKESIEVIERGIDHLRSVGIDVTGQFMIGNPGETLETVKESIKFAKESKLTKAVFGGAVPFPKTSLWDYVEEHGTFLIEPDCTRFEDIFPRVIFETPEFSKEDRLQSIKLVEEAGMQPNANQPNSLARILKKAAALIWFRFIYGLLPNSISTRLYFLLRKIKAKL